MEEIEYPFYDVLSRKAKPELIYDIFSKERECIVKDAI
jgi:hypothetical protein